MQEQKSFDYRDYTVMIILIAINIIIYMYCTYAGEVVYNRGCMDAERVLLDGEYYRFFTSMFMHGGIDHIFSNMIFLAALGEMLERVIGHVRFTVLYLISGVGGSLFSVANVVLSGKRYTAIGASGAVFGLIGAMLILVVINNGHYQGISIKRMIFAIAYMVYSGTRTERVDNAAHVGGLIFGVLIMAAMYVIEVYKPKKQDYDS